MAPSARFHGRDRRFDRGGWNSARLQAGAGVWWQAITDKPIELSIEVPAETRRAIERVAAERGMTASEYLEYVLRKSLIDAGYLDEEADD